MSICKYKIKFPEKNINSFTLMAFSPGEKYKFNNVKNVIIV